MTSSVRIVGDPSRFAEQLVSSIAEHVESRVREALEAARKIVERAYEESASKLESELRRALREAEEQVQAYTAKREVELRKRLAEIRAKAVEEIMSVALQRLREYVGLEAYKEFIKRLLDSALETASRRSRRVIVHPARPDQAIVAELAPRVAAEKGIEVEVGEAVEGAGGFTVRAVEAGLTLDYRLEVILAPALEEARARVLEVLNQ
ncbi:V-type ATP synthase subunit E [Hyperthermus butylicus]|uniref:A-type ATP synthase subunit E n=1 Tax=Hyperthermus butylicus (strain DSM 5456 / JCM 9403 / PLM1-5) TaxID=415426 RepID=AATE_HYPBU|nr:V-type ATP synthase subunit E family protein [Hyperthermus butylicus]A2BKX7.1 RecName: Full=V-type ATP synthase subunit E; AltName: Full=V-ATPase subunit E [Hyperthermus butylicus DSM 5456]ABM80638.1 hypothetical protein Hbut_0785 [Hyperthermus butylicus DSM 5456]